MEEKHHDLLVEFENENVTSAANVFENDKIKEEALPNVEASEQQLQ